MEIVEKKYLDVKCEFDDSHIITKVVEVKPGTEYTESTVHIYCPYCNKWSNGKILGDLHEDAEVERFFDDDE